MGTSTGRRPVRPAGPAGRLSAIGGAATALAGAGLVVVAVATLPQPWAGYVSEAGVADHPRATLYRWGILGLAAALGLLGASLTRLSRTAAALLVGGGALGLVSGTVPCSGGCPLPPYDQATTADLVHAVASALAVGAAILGMLRLAGLTSPSALRFTARLGFVVAAPLGAAQGLSMLVFGPDPPTGALERVLLAIVFGWLLASCLLRAVGSALLPAGTTQPEQAETAGEQGREHHRGAAGE